MVNRLDQLLQPKVSVIITTRNEAKNIRHLLDSLLHQDNLHEVIIVDANSTDQTVAIVESYRDLLPKLQVKQQACKRGEGRNIGANLATGDWLAFIDGDCMANSRWLAAAIDGAKANEVIAGRTILIGYWAFTKLHRVELPHKQSETTWPSCNLLYPKPLFEKLDGFDPEFVTAEDIDLNFRAIEGGATIRHVREAIVYARARESITGFLRQAYWNGYGRKQLTRKHGRLWHQYSFTKMLALQGASLWGILRMAWGFLGYMRAKLQG